MASAARFKQADLTRAFKGAAAAGIRVSKVEIDPSGRIVILTDSASPLPVANEWDEVLR